MATRFNPPAPEFFTIHDDARITFHDDVVAEDDGETLRFYLGGKCLIVGPEAGMAHPDIDQGERKPFVPILRAALETAAGVPTFFT